MQQLLRLCLVAFVVTSAASISRAQPAQQLQGTTLKGEGDFSAFAAEQAANNSKPGPRLRPAETIPVPTEGVSAEAQGLIAAPFPPHMNAEPKNAAEWKDLIERRAALNRAAVPAMREKLQVSVQSVVIGGVKCFIVTPNNMPEANRNRLLVHVHGGGYVFAPGEAALPEALMIAGFGGFKVISVDYRMPPDFPSRRDGRRDGGVEAGRHHGRPEEHGHPRHLDRRRHDPGDGAACQERRLAAARRHRARHAVVRHRRHRRYLQDQRVGR
jgi:hypothetical protein